MSESVGGNMEASDAINSVALNMEAQLRAVLKERDQLREALAAKFSVPCIVPDGWKPVPILPTHEMVRASCDAMGATQAVRMAIEAAPAPPVVGAMRFDSALLNELILGVTNASYATGEWQENSADGPLHELVNRVSEAKDKLVRYLLSTYSPEQAQRASDCSLTDPEYCALDYVRRALEAISERKELIVDTIEPLNDIRKASLRAKYALERFSPVFDRLTQAPEMTMEAQHVDSSLRNEMAYIAAYSISDIEKKSLDQLLGWAIGILERAKRSLEVQPKKDK